MGRIGLLACGVVACGRVEFKPFGEPMISCADLPETCGPAGESPCCANELVPGGTFQRSFDLGSDGAYPDLTNPATVGDFRIDTYEVTVGRFRNFVEAGMGTRTSPPPIFTGARALNGVPRQAGWSAQWNDSLEVNQAALVDAVKCSSIYETWTDTPANHETLAMNCITWFEAFAFCIWDGGFLPTEAQWNYAATGGDEQRAYPWSNPPASLTIDCSYANYAVDVPAGTFCVNATTGGVNRVGSESPGDSRWGAADLGGNVSEWTLDAYATPYPNPCSDCAKFEVTPLLRAFRGGAFRINAPGLRTAIRYGGAPQGRALNVGVRCARPISRAP